MSRQQQGRRAGRTSTTTTLTRLPPYLVVPAAGLAGSLVYGYWYFQDEAPFTGRKRLLATSEAWERQLGDREYKNLLKQYKKDILPPDHRASVTVDRVGARIAAAADRFTLEQRRLKRLQTDSPNTTEIAKPSKYTYTVVRSEQANAFVLPNNHVFVLTGLFRNVHSEDELAAVLGHEMAHNLARHAGERISGSIVVNLMARATLLVDPTGALYSVFLPAAKVLSELPHSREHEVEADYIGLRLASDACYDPRAARRVFASMKEGSGGGGGGLTEFMSTHPSYDTRLENFDSWMPDAMEKFNEGGGMKCREVREEMRLARKRAAMAAEIRQRRN